jgi:hypothetical protein
MILTIDTEKETAAGMRRAAALLAEIAAQRDGAPSMQQQPPSLPPKPPRAQPLPSHEGDQTEELDNGVQIIY